MAEVVSNSWTWKAIHDFFPWDACGTPRKKIRFGLFLIARTIIIAKPANSIAENLYRLLFSSSKLTNGIVQNLYRFSIDLLPLNNVSERAKFDVCQFLTRRLGWLVNWAKSFGILASHGMRPRPNYFCLYWVFPIMILFRLGPGFS